MSQVTAEVKQLLATLEDQRNGILKKLVGLSEDDARAITGALARTYAYDAAGNTTGYSSMTATYNNAGRLKTVANGSATEILVSNILPGMLL